MADFQGKVVLITGASTGIGAALARELAKKGANLVLVARSAEKLAALAAELDRTGQKILVTPGDVTQDGDLERAAALARDRFGKIDIAIANAGFGVKGNLEALTVEDYRKQFETNVFGVLRMIYATLEDLKKTQGCLAIVGSVNGYVTFGGISAYGMSKFALRALWESLRTELAPYGISVIHICPGFVATENRLAKFEAARQRGESPEIPTVLLMSTEKTAQQIVAAIAQRRPEIVLTSYGKLAVWLKGHFPGLLAGLFKLIGIDGQKNKFPVKLR